MTQLTGLALSFTKVQISILPHSRVTPPTCQTDKQAKFKLNQGAIYGYITRLLTFFEFKLRFKFFRFNYTKLLKKKLGKTGCVVSSLHPTRNLIIN